MAELSHPLPSRAVWALLLFTWVPKVIKCFPVLHGLHGFLIRCSAVTSHNPLDWIMHYLPVIGAFVGLALVKLIHSARHSN